MILREKRVSWFLAKQAVRTKTDPMLQWLRKTGLNKAGSWPLALALVLLTFMLPLAAPGQDTADVHITPRVDPMANPHAPDPALRAGLPLLKSNVNLVLVPVTVTDPMDRLVTGLDKENFTIYQDKQPEQIRNLSSDDAPISVGVILDISGSMGDKIQRAREAVAQFLETANPQDEFFLITFSDGPHLVSPFTSRVQDIESQLPTVESKGMTALLDAIYLGIDEMHHAQYPRKALLIISDGGDNHSRYTEGEVKSMVQEADVQIFAIGLYDQFPRTVEEQEGPGLLREVTDATGGRAFTIDNPNELADVATKIGIALRDEYVIAYQPKTRPHDGKYHKITIKLRPPKGLPPLHISAKRGFYAPSQ
jgi:Ca-activated chloride channel family protein